MIYDVAVIGGGPGGYAAAFETVRYGLSTILFERNWSGEPALTEAVFPRSILPMSQSWAWNYHMPQDMVWTFNTAG